MWWCACGVYRVCEAALFHHPDDHIVHRRDEEHGRQSGRTARVILLPMSMPLLPLLSKWSLVDGWKSVYTPLFSDILHHNRVQEKVQKKWKEEKKKKAWEKALMKKKME